MSSPSSTQSSATVLNLPEVNSFEGGLDSGLGSLGNGCDEFPVPNDWTICVHPQGWVYFSNPKLQVVTDADIRKPDVYDLTLSNCSQYPLSDLGEDMEVQLHIQAGPAPTLFNLAINHAHCIASYSLHEAKSEAMTGIDPHTLNRRRRLYWNYVWNHPAHIRTPERAVKDASDALTWFYTDNLISGARSIVPFSKQECDDLSRVVRDMNLPCNDSSVSKTVFLAWLLRETCSFRDAEQYGLHTSKDSAVLRSQRLSAKQPSSRQAPPYALPVITFIMNTIFFSIPWTYFAHVKNSSEYRGRLVSVQRNWEAYIERLVREYSHFLLISTVLLSATVGVLAVPNIALPGRVAATVSAFASLGSVIVGVFCIWKHQTNTQTINSFTYMYNAKHSSWLGFHGHAMLLSLPAVLLVWAILTFTISIVFYTMQGITDHDILDGVSAWIIIGFFIVIMMSVIVALYTFSIIWKFQRRTSWIWNRMTFWRTVSNPSDKAQAVV